MCGKIGAEIGAVAPDCAIVHQAVLQEDLLAGNDAIGSKDHGSGGIDEFFRNRRRVLGLDRKQNKDRETCRHRHERGDSPPRRQ